MSQSSERFQHGLNQRISQKFDVDKGKRKRACMDQRPCFRRARHNKRSCVVDRSNKRLGVSSLLSPWQRRAEQTKRCWRRQLRLEASPSADLRRVRHRCVAGRGSRPRSNRILALRASWGGTDKTSPVTMTTTRGGRTKRVRLGGRSAAGGLGLNVWPEGNGCSDGKVPEQDLGGKHVGWHEAVDGDAQCHLGKKKPSCVGTETTRDRSASRTHKGWAGGGEDSWD